VLCQGLAVRLGAERVQQPGRPLDVAEEEGDCSRGKISLHATTSCASAGGRVNHVTVLLAGKGVAPSG
jgi:hypothetical protein